MSLKKKPNTILKHERQQRGWSQQKIAEVLGTSEDVISRWERGERSPSPFYQEKLCQLFEKPANQLGLIACAPFQDMALTMPMSELDMPSIEIPSTTFLDFGILGRLERIFTPRPKVDAAMLNYLQTGLDGLKLHLIQGNQTNWHNLVVTAKNQLGLYTNLLESHIERTDQLILFTGENCLVLGDALFNMKDYANASRYYEMALRAAHEAHNVPLQAVASGRYSLLLIDVGQYTHARQLLELALDTSEQSISSVICSWLWAVKAEVYANEGEEKYCFEALEAAKAHLHLNNERQDCYTFNPELVPSVYGTTKLLGFEGACYLRLNQPDEARRVLAASQKLSFHPHHQSLINVDFARSFMLQNNPKEASAFAIQALTFVQQTGSRRAYERIVSIREALQPWDRLPEVRELDQHISLPNTVGVQL